MVIIEKAKTIFVEQPEILKRDALDKLALVGKLTPAQVTEHLAAKSPIDKLRFNIRFVRKLVSDEYPDILAYLRFFRGIELVDYRSEKIKITIGGFKTIGEGDKTWMDIGDEEMFGYLGRGDSVFKKFANTPPDRLINHMSNSISRVRHTRNRVVNFAGGLFSKH